MGKWARRVGRHQAGEVDRVMLKIVEQGRLKEAMENGTGCQLVDFLLGFEPIAGWPDLEDVDAKKAVRR